MPLYTLQCSKCDDEADHFLRSDERETPQECQVEGCDGEAKRLGIERPGLLRPGGAYEFGLILGNTKHGKVVKGHYGGKDAPRKPSAQRKVKL